MTGAPTLTLRERRLYEHLRERHGRGEPAPSLADLREALGPAALDAGLAALAAAGLVQPTAARDGRVRLASPTDSVPTQLPLLGPSTPPAL